MSELPSRVRVTGPPRVVRRGPRRSLAAQIDAQTELGDLYVSSLLRSQLRSALQVLAALALLGGGLPLLFVLAPGLSRVHVAGMPLPWVLLAVVVYPLLVGLGWFYVRQSERHEAEFTRAVEDR